MSRFRRGDVILLNLTGKMRPWLVVSNNIHNNHAQTVNVVYMTTRDKRPLPVHAYTDYGNIKPSLICVEEIHTVVPPYNTPIIEHIPREYMRAVCECIKIQFDTENKI